MSQEVDAHPSKMAFDVDGWERYDLDKRPTWLAVDGIEPECESLG